MSWRKHKNYNLTEGKAFHLSAVLSDGPVTQAQTQGLRMDRVQFPTFARVLRDCRFRTVQNSASRTDRRVSNAD